MSSAGTRACRLKRTDIYGRDYFVWVASNGCGSSCGHDHPTKRLAVECARMNPIFVAEDGVYEVAGDGTRTRISAVLSQDTPK